jgi:heme exporter protein B
MIAVFAVFRRELKVAGRLGGGAGLGLAFYLAVVVALPLGIGPDQAALRRLAPGLVWIGALLATLIALDRLFQPDAEDGTLDVLIGSTTPLPALVAAKCAAHWLAAVAPLVLAAPLFGVMLGLPPGELAGLAASLAIGTPGLVALGAVGAALTATLRRGGALAAVLVLPLAAPLLVFGVAAAAGDAGPLAVVGGLSLLAVAGGPFAAAAALEAGRG